MSLYTRVWKNDGLPRCKRCHVLVDTICNDCGQIHFKSTDGYCDECKEKIDKKNGRKKKKNT